ncbi:MAG: hypothetical protein INH41_08830 [Myxococcaceae bacterium]|nr:hypothetical protein [Myxococcaceae bacterium]MCA3012488.1 hypothetical protein [Myxococcaceae bacterium]
MPSSCLVRSLAAVTVLFAAPGWPCAGEDGEPVSYFDAAVLSRPGLQPFLYTPGASFHERAVPPGDENLDEWAQFFEGKVDRAAWAQLLYRDGLERLDALINRLSAKQPVAPPPADAAFFAFPDRPRLLAALMYVGFAKRVEPIALAARPADAWSEPVVVDRAAQAPRIDRLSAAGAKQAAAERDPFLRQRYAFQLLRLQFYRGDAPKVLALAETWRSELSRPGVIGARALCTVGGALRRSGDLARANLAFARAWDASDDVKEVALVSLKLASEKDLAATLALAQTPRERAVVWTLLGARGSELRALEQVRTLAPDSDLQGLLLARAVVKAVGKVEGAGAVDGARLVRWLRSEVAKQPRSFQLQLALAHTGAARADAKAFAAASAAAALAPADAATQRQLRVTSAYALLSAPGPLDEALLLRHVAPLLTAPVGSDFDAFVREALSRRWATQAPVLSAAFLGAPKGFDLRSLLALEAFLAGGGKTPVEQLAVQGWTAPPQRLARHIALARLAGADAVGAQAAFASDASPLGADPFWLHARDCLECDQADTARPTVTRAQALTRMAALQRAGSPEALVELGTALYNFTEWGNACVGEHELNQAFFQSAAALARRALQAKDREVRARAALLLAKTELQAFYQSPAYVSDRVDFQAGEGFRALAGLEDTRFAREVLAECGYYRTFRGKR